MPNNVKREFGKTYVYLIRHAHWVPPKGPHKFNPNLPLSKLGKIQAKALSRKISPLKGKIDVFICSSLGRAKETAEAISGTIGKKPIQCDRLWEFHKIFWTTKYYKLNYWKNLMKYKRVIKRFNEILLQNRGKIILIVAHGNVIKGILKNKQNLPIAKIRDIDYKNCYLTLLRFNGLKLEKVYCFNTKNVVKIID
jgi:broad specificity phosphatase PhoE